MDDDNILILGITLMVTFLVVLLIIVPFKPNIENTNARTIELVIHTDKLTGCQYLSITEENLIPRVDKLGRHLCRAVEQ